MGAWGHKAFDNDDALDWLHELQGTTELGVLKRALQLRWHDYLYLQAPKGSVIIAAAEVLADALGNSAAELPNEAKSWVHSNSRLPYKSLVNMARTGLRRVLGARSELRSLWKESAQLPSSWEKTIHDLLQRLKG
jgi:hypothetical protein